MHAALACEAFSACLSIAEDMCWPHCNLAPCVSRIRYTLLMRTRALKTTAVEAEESDYDDSASDPDFA